MNKVLNLVLINTLLVTISATAQPVELVELNRIVIPDNIFVGDIATLDVEGDKILITDESIQQVLLFDSQKWIKLDPTVCHPGFRFSPIEAHFGDEEEIFISNSTIWGFRFKKNSDCVGAAHKDFLAPEKLHYSDLVVGLSTDFEQSIIKVWNKDGSRTDVAFSFPNKFPNAEYRLKHAGIAKLDDDIFVVNTLEPEIHKFEISTGNHFSNSFNSEKFKENKSDVPQSVNDPKLFKRLGEIFSSKSTNVDLFLVNEEYGVVVTATRSDNKKVYNCTFFSVEDLSISGEIELNEMPIYIGNDKAVFVNRKKTDNENESIELVFKSIIIND